MKALTLHQPWAWAVAYAGKDGENRGWRPPRCFIGQRIAIHAGKKFDHDASLYLLRPEVSPVPGHLLCSIPTADDCVKGAVVAVTTIAGFAELVVKENGVRIEATMHRNAEMRMVNKWASMNLEGDCYWFLENTIALPKPVLCRGMQKLWELPRDVEAAVMAQVSS